MADRMPLRWCREFAAGTAPLYAAGMGLQAIRTVRFTCDCGAVLTVPAAAVGKTVTCAECGAALRVPLAKQSPLHHAAGRNCPFCSSPMPAKALSCPRCGTDLRTIESDNARCQRYLHAARAAWVVPVAAGGVSLLVVSVMGSSSPAARWVAGILMVLTIVLGFGCALYALTGTRKHGTHGIAVPAATGLLLGGIALFIAVGLFPRNGTTTSSSGPTLAEARQGFSTTLLRTENVGQRTPVPPRGVLELVRYASPSGGLSAYVTPAPEGSARQPAIIWLFGGFGNSIGSEAWTPAPADNDQSAIAFAEAGVVTMYPSLRGGNDNPGVMESFYGELDDVLAAADFLRSLPYVDPNRVYLGGHSTGGTLALLTAEYSDRFRGVFAFGPVADVMSYGKEELVFDTSNPKECELRAPIRWLHGIHTPTFVFEGTAGQSNIDALRQLSRACKNPAVRFIAVKGADHFSILAPASRLIAEKILQDTGETPILAFTDSELARVMGK
jgi:acetyl esterase/lipase